MQSFKSIVRLPLFLLGIMVLMSSCGYTLEFKRVKDPNEEDPITVIRREIRQMKADHRVAIFDLKKHQEQQEAKLKSDLDKELDLVRQDLQETRLALGEKNAEFDDRFIENDLKQRQIYGRIEEEANRVKEDSARTNSFILKELENLSQKITTQETHQKSLENTLNTFQERQKEETQALRVQLNLIQDKNAANETLSDHQGKTLEEVTSQVSQIIDQAVPTINSLAARVDDLEWQVKQFNNDTKTESLKKRLEDLAKSIDVQRKSLEKLGSTVTSQVDKQQGMIQQSIKRLDTLEGKTTSKGQ